MELMIVRHGPAGDRADWAKTGRADSDRPLTKDGRRKTEEAAAGLRVLAGGVELVGTSPWARAAQTAKIVAREYGVKAAAVPFLVPDRPYEEAAAWLAGRKERTVALVGHEPHLSGLVAWLLTGGPRPALELKKSGAVLLELPRPAAGAARLLWALPPRALRALGGR